jgi:hypothetical protein
MAIVTIGKLPLQVPENGSAEYVIELIQQMKSMILHLIGRCFEESLETEVERILGGKRYVRRGRAKRKETGIYCSKCRSHQRQDFRRNGHYQRQLALQWGRIYLQAPQAKCRCGGNVRLKYQTLRPGQRIWDDLELEIQTQYSRGLSYRQITLLKKGEVPPVVRVDGIWITVMFSSGETKTDRAGRRRLVKRAKKVTRSTIRLLTVCAINHAYISHKRSCPQPGEVRHCHKLSRSHSRTGNRGC